VNIYIYKILLPAGIAMGALYHKLQAQSIVPEDGRDHRPKHVELIGIITKPLLLHLVGCLYYLYGRILLHYTYQKFYLGCSYLWIRNMDPMKK